MKKYFLDDIIRQSEVIRTALRLLELEEQKARQLRTELEPGEKNRCLKISILKSTCKTYTAATYEKGNLSNKRKSCTRP